MSFSQPAVWFSEMSSSSSDTRSLVLFDSVWLSRFRVSGFSISSFPPPLPHRVSPCIPFTLPKFALHVSSFLISIRSNSRFITSYHIGNRFFIITFPFPLSSEAFLFRNAYFFFVGRPSFLSSSSSCKAVSFSGGKAQNERGIRRLTLLAFLRLSPPPQPVSPQACPASAAGGRLLISDAFFSSSLASPNFWFPPGVWIRHFFFSRGMQTLLQVRGEGDVIASLPFRKSPHILVSK